MTTITSNPLNFNPPLPAASDLQAAKVAEARNAMNALGAVEFATDKAKVARLASSYASECLALSSLLRELGDDAAADTLATWARRIGVGGDQGASKVAKTIYALRYATARREDAVKYVIETRGMRNGQPITPWEMEASGGGARFATEGEALRVIEKLQAEDRDIDDDIVREYRVREEL